MKILLAVFPVALLGAYSQIIVKIRASKIAVAGVPDATVFERILAYLSDPLLLSGYVTGLAASLLWLFVVTKLPLVVAFPIYIGVTFLLVLVGGWILLDESITPMRLAASTLILCGVAIGTKS